MSTNTRFYSKAKKGEIQNRISESVLDDLCELSEYRLKKYFSEYYWEVLEYKLRKHLASLGGIVERLDNDEWKKVLRLPRKELIEKYPEHYFAVMRVKRKHDK